MRAVLSLISCALLAGCSVSAAQDSQANATKNECSENAECGAGVCEAGSCRAKAGEFGKVLFDVTAPTDARAIAGARFLKLFENVGVQGGDLQLALGRIARVSGTLSPAKAGDQTCTFDGGTPATTVQARISFTPSERPLGLTIPVYTTTTQRTAEAAHAYKLNVPPGEYDIYVQDASTPSKASEPTAALAVPQLCSIVPKVIRRVVVESGSVILPLVMHPPAKLGLTVIRPKEASSLASLENWSVDIIEPISGRVVSTSASLAEPKDSRYTETLYYSPNEDPAQAGLEFVRFSPPAGVNAPTILLQRSSLELFNAGQGTIDQFSGWPDPVDLEGRVERKSTSAPVSASVTLVATEITQLRGTIASFKQTVETDAEGRFKVRLLPGKYKVHAVPEPASGAAATNSTLEVAQSPQMQAGKLIELADLTRISGTVYGPAGQPIAGASVSASATPVATGLLDAALGMDPFLPRATGCYSTAETCIASTLRDGFFSIQADPGAFDVSIRPSDESGFSWFVRPNVQAAGESSDLGSLQMPLPVVYRGHVATDDTGPIGGALIRAYIYPKDRNASGTSAPPGAQPSPKAVVQVAETRAADDGSFELHLPSGIGQ